jgi:hypothetical protein
MSSSDVVRFPECQVVMLSDFHGDGWFLSLIVRVLSSALSSYISRKADCEDSRENPMTKKEKISKAFILAIFCREMR